MNMVYPENIEEIKKFAEGICIDVKYLLGKRYGCSLYLTSVESLPSNTIFNINEKIYFPIDHKVKVIWN